MSDKDNEPATIVDLMASVENSSDDVNDYFLSEKNPDVELKSSRKEAASVAVRDRLIKANMLLPESQLEPHFLDEYRRIKRPLLANAFGKTASLVTQGNLILVTSSLPGEGKTNTAANLALSIAREKDHTVLLVDCDASQQGISRMFGLTDKQGLVDVLMNDSLTVGDVLLSTDIPGLCVVGAGKNDEYVTELLASQRMSDVVEEMAARYSDRVIIIDGPPLLPTPQTQVLAGLVGQIVFVIEAGKTAQLLVEEALEILPEEKAVGLVMNKTEGLLGGEGYYYGYYGSDK